MLVLVDLVNSLLEIMAAALIYVLLAAVTDPSGRPDQLLLLAAEMRAPGRGWLQFELTLLADGQTRLVQTAMWDPVGLAGHLYWFSLWPLHEVIFRSLINGVATESGCLQPSVAGRRLCSTSARPIGSLFSAAAPHAT